MIIRLENPSLEGNEKSYLSADAAAGASSLTVQNTEGLVANDYIVIGKYGVDQTELCQISSVSGNHTLTLSAVTKFAHSHSSTGSKDHEIIKFKCMFKLSSIYLLQSIGMCRYRPM